MTRFTGIEILPIVLFVVVGCGQNQPIKPSLSKNPFSTPKARMDGVYRAGKAIEGAISVGVNKMEFSSLRAKMATELLIATDEAKYSSDISEKQEMAGYLAMYEKVLSAYNTSDKAWDFYTRFSGCSSSRRFCEDLYKSEASKLQGILAQDGIEANPFSTIFLQEIWATAKKLQDEADAKLLSPEQKSGK